MRKLLIGLVAILFWSGASAHNLGEVVGKVLPSVTYIEVERFIEQNIVKIDNDEGADQSVEKIRIPITPVIGSGFVIDNNLVVTNYHVISYMLNRPDSRIWVSFYNADDDVFLKYPATLIGYDQVADVALLRILENQQGVELCKTGDINLGEEVFSITNFYGIRFSLTTGIVSSLNRYDERFPYIKLVQLQLVGGSGSSGGPVFNENGQVAAMNHTVLNMDGNDNFNKNSIMSMVSFSISSEVVLSVIHRIEEQGGGEVIRPDLGVMLLSFGAQSRTYQEINNGQNEYTGLIVKSEDRGSQSTAFQIGDIIVSVNGKAFTSPRLFFIHLDERYKVGDSVKLQVYRNKKLINMTVNLIAARRI